MHLTFQLMNSGGLMAWQLVRCTPNKITVTQLEEIAKPKDGSQFKTISDRTPKFPDDLDMSVADFVQHLDTHYALQPPVIAPNNKLVEVKLVLDPNVDPTATVGEQQNPIWFVETGTVFLCYHNSDN